MPVEMWIYLANVVDNIQAFCLGALPLYCVVMGLISFAHALSESDKYYEHDKTKPSVVSIMSRLFFGKIFYVLLILFTIGAFIPDQKTAYLMLGANVIKNSDTPALEQHVIDKKLHEMLESK